MPCDTEITYINKSINKDSPKVFVFAQNELPSFSAIKDGVAWRVIENIGRGSKSRFVYPINTQIFASWDNQANQTKTLEAETGKRYTVTQDNTGIVLIQNGNAINQNEIELTSDIQVKSGISAFLSKNSNILVNKKMVAYKQKATFKLSRKIYWGIASEIQSSDAINSAVLDSDIFFEQDLENISSSIISLNGNAYDGYSFKIEDQE